MTTDLLAKRVLEKLSHRGLTLSTAESCTGGWLGKLLTDVPGSSANYYGGVVSYTNGVKENVLGVSAATLQEYGAVSRHTAVQMAQGVRRIIGADVGVGITGLAGPGGDGSGKPVGLVYLSVSCDGKTVCRRCVFPGDRERIRSAACREALQLILDEIG